MEANGARAQGEWGAELGAGYNLSFQGFTLRPIGGVFVHSGDHDGYEWQNVGGGQSRCRNLGNGQLADDDRCESGRDVSLYGRLEATYTLVGTTEFGVGARISGDEPRVYGTLSFPVLPRIRVKANAGDRYYALGLRADL
ncbi:hypothetical protein GRI97_02230 [Altererythrobacter xixiisoli]|uniref:Uncharacterized protein n=1 Tax=Croceibacterium xixiisoli TaxID=1476466 RepID=A0A6I4TPE5_9SPHN|nr:hypothetical protein [Croceibacterium xixiisoli]